MTSPLRIARPRPADPSSRDLTGAVLIEALALPQRLPGDPAAAWQVANVSDWAEYLFAPVALSPLPALSLKQGAALAPTDLALGVSGAELAFALAPTSAPLPAGLSLGAAGVLAGTPAAPAAAARIVVRAANAAGHVDRAFDLAVASAAPALLSALPALSLKQGTPAAPVALAPSFGGAGLSFALAPTSPPLPAGLSLSAAGVLSGTPVASALGALVVVRARNAFGFADAGLGLVVRASAPTATGALPDRQVTQGVAVSLDLAGDFAGEGLAFALAPSSAPLPAGLTLSAQGLLAGTPTALAPAATLVVRAANAFGLADSAFEVAVVGAPVAYDYLIDSEARRAEVMALPVATLSGKTIAFAPGDYTWAPAEWSARAYAAETTFVSRDPSNRARFLVAAGSHWVNAQNVTIQNMRLLCPWTDGISTGLDSCIVMRGTQRNVRIKGCDLAGNVKAQIGDGKLRGFKGFFGSDGSTTLPTGYYFEIIDCTIRELLRGVNVRVTGGGTFRLIGCDIHDILVDCGVIAGENTGLVQINWNVIRDFLYVPTVQYPVIAVDLAANRMTIQVPSLSGWAVGGTRTINIGNRTTTPPGGTNLPGIGGSNDFGCTVFAVNTTAKTVTLSFPVDITSAGSNVFLNGEPAHTDGFQFIPGKDPGTLPTNYEAIGNRGLLNPSEDGVWPQLIFAEDVSSSGSEGHFVNATMAANMLVGGANNAIYISNPIAALIADNTVLKPADIRSANPNVALASSWGWPGWGNRMDNNVSGAVGASPVVQTTLEGNSVIGSGYATLGVFTGADLSVPSTIAALTANFQRNDLGGTIDYIARTYDLPRLNTVTVAGGSFAFAPQTGVAQGAVVTAAPVQVTAILNGQGAAASHGALAGIGGGLKAQLRVTSDQAGTQVKRDWSSDSYMAAPGDWVWVRQTVGVELSKAHRVALFLGRTRAVFEATTVAVDALPVAYGRSFAAGDASAGWIGANATLAYDDAGDELDVSTTAAYGGTITSLFRVTGGKRYRAEVTLRNLSGVPAEWDVRTAQAGGTVRAILQSDRRHASTGVTTRSLDFTATATEQLCLRIIQRAGVATPNALGIRSILVRELPA